MLLLIDPFLASLFSHFAHLHQVAPVLLGSTLAAITGGLLALRLLDGRTTPIFFHLSALTVAVLALAHVAGMVPLGWPLTVASWAVVLLLVEEGFYVLARVFAQFVQAGRSLGQDAARLVNRNPHSAPVSSLRSSRPS